LSIDLSATYETFVLEAVCQDQIYRSTVHFVRSECSTILCEMYVGTFWERVAGPETRKGWKDCTCSIIQCLKNHGTLLFLLMKKDIICWAQLN